MVYTINIARDFSRYPAGRYISDGPFTGEGFLTEKLLPAVEANNKICVELDGTLGYGSSFLEEAFGGLMRVKNWTFDQWKQHVELSSPSDPNLIAEIEHYVRKEAKVGKKAK